jgi:SAM-dependent methyltransferase
MAHDLQPGVDRFGGFGDLYDSVRPTPPADLAAMLTDYVGGRPRLLVDLGSGTGLSTRWAGSWAEQVIGVEPNDDMRAVAERRAGDGVSFRGGWSHATGLPDDCADVVLVVQALHWMEPTSTFREVARLLRPGGVFAAVDCDWPPVVGDAETERAWDDCMRRSRVLEARLAEGLRGDELRRPIDPHDLAAVDHSGIDTHRNRQLSENVRSWSKSEHLSRMSASSLFSWCREVVLSAAEDDDATRFVELLKSQGGYQTLRRHGLDDRDLGVDELDRIAHARLPGLTTWRFMYRARLAFKPPADYSV